MDPGKTSWRIVPKEYAHVRSQDLDHFKNWFVATEAAGHYVLGTFWEGEQYWAEGLTDKQLERKFVKGLER